MGSPIPDQRDEMRLREIAKSVGEPPRGLGFFRKRFEPLPRPPWLKDDDLISRIYAHQEQTYRKGLVRWAAVVHANNTLFRPGKSDSGAQVVYAPDGDVPLSGLRKIASRCHSLKGTTPTDPALRRLANMLTDEMERALDWPVPQSLTGGPHVITTIVMLPRQHMIGGVLGLTHFPIYADPATSMALLIPSKHWPADFQAEWNDHARAIHLHARSLPPVQLSSEAAEMVRFFAEQNQIEQFVLLVRPGKVDIVEELNDPGEHVILESQGISVAVLKTEAESLRGTVIDYHQSGTAAGFVFGS